MRTLPISRYRQQQSFKAIYKVCPGTEFCSDMPSRFSRTVLHIVEWYKNKIASGKEENDPYIEQLKDYLDRFPGKKEYKDFDPLSVEDIRPDESETLRVCSYSEEDNGERNLYWVMQSIEPVPGTAITLITDISVFGTADEVLLGIRGSKRYPCDCDDSCDYYRPAFLRSIIKWDEKYIKLAGETENVKFFFGDKALRINGKSGTECDEFISTLLEDPKRQFPVFLLSEEQYYQLGEEKGYQEKDEQEQKGRMIVDVAAEALMGYAYIFIVEGSPRKIFNRDGYREYIDDLANGELMCSSRYGKPAVLEAIEESRSEGFFTVNKDSFFVGSFLELQRDRMEQNVYDFGDMLFYQELWLKKRDKELREMLSGDDRDPEQLIKTIKELQDVIQQIRSESEEKQDELKRRNETIIEENERLKNENRKLDNYNKSLKEKKDELKNLNQELQDNAEAAKQQEDQTVTIGMSQKQFVDKHKGLLNPPARYHKDEIPDWIRKYYSETLILHERAEKSLMDANRQEGSIRILVAMIHYLHGCTLYWNEGGRGLDPDKKILEEYVLDKYRFDICDSTDKTLKEKDNLKKYSIDIGSYYEDAYDRDIIEKKKDPIVIIGQHVKYGVGYGDEPSMVRLYYYYDSDLKKSVIGYMPGHLPTFSG